MSDSILKFANKHINFLPFILLTAVDILFLNKYATRITTYTFGFIALYLVIKAFVYAQIFGIDRVKVQLNLFWIIITDIVLLQVFIIYKIDPMLVGVDRWDCVIFWWDAVFEGTFPYASRTRFGGFFSPYPFYELFYLPFYFLREVGWANIFFILAFLYYLKSLKLDNKQLLIVVLTIGLSMPYWWEICVRSTLFLNSFLILILIQTALNTTNNNIKNIVFLGLLSGFFLSSRMVMIMPIISIVSYKYLKNFEIKSCIIFGIAMIVAFSFTFLPLFLVWGVDAFFENNPFKHHNNHMPFIFTILYLIASFLIGYFTKTKEKLILSIGIILWTMGLFFISWAVYKHGLQKAYFDGKGSGDISYFLLSFAPLLFSLTHKKTTNA